MASCFLGLPLQYYRERESIVRVSYSIDFSESYSRLLNTSNLIIIKVCVSQVTPAALAPNLKY